MAWGSGPAMAGLEPGGAGFFVDGAGAKASRVLCGSSVRSPRLWASRPMLPARTARTPRPQQSLHPAPLHGRVTPNRTFALTIVDPFLKILTQFYPSF